MSNMHLLLHVVTNYKEIKFELTHRLNISRTDKVYKCTIKHMSKGELKIEIAGDAFF